MRTDFHIKAQINTIEDINLNEMVQTAHFSKERIQRFEYIKSILDGEIGEAVASFRVDEEDGRGDTIHTLTDKGVVVIQNYFTKRLITIYLAIPSQVRRLFNDVVPIDYYYIVELTKHYVRKGWCGNRH